MKNIWMSVANILSMLSAFFRAMNYRNFKKHLSWLIKETRGLNYEKIKKGLPVIAIYLFRRFIALLRYLNNLKYRNLKIGSTILILLFLVSWFTEPVPESNELLIFDEDGKFVAAPPAPPSFTFPLGTDMGARSMVNLVVVGVKYTLGAVLGITLARILIGGLLAMVTALWLPNFRRYFSAFFWPFRYIPALLIGIILMIPVAATPLGISAKIILEYQLIVLLVIGLPGVYFFIIELADEIQKQPYVLSSSLMGAGKFHMLIKHIWPNIKSHILLLGTQQILTILQLLTFLGIFSLYLGGPHPTALTDEPRLIYRTMTNELAGMAGQNFWLIRRAPWMAYSPILMIAFIAIIVNWMKKEVEDHISGVVSVKHRTKTAEALPTVIENSNLSKSFVLLGMQQHPKEAFVQKKYISDLIHEKFRMIRRFLQRYAIYRIIENLTIRVTDYISNNEKPVFTTILTLSLVLWAGVFSYAEYREQVKPSTKEKSVEASAELEGERNTFDTSFTNKEHIPVSYKADLTYLDADATLTGSLHVSTTNTTGADQDKLYFHLYPNQFKEPLDGPEWEFVSGPSPVPGWIDILEIKVNNEKADFKVDGTILEINMKDWADKATAELDFQFDFQLPTNYSNASYDYAAVWLGNFLPKQAVFDKNGWNLDPYSPIGFPFYSETANYDVTINAASKFEILSNAEEAKATLETQGETSKYNAKVENVRDFALVLLDKQYYQREIFMTSDETAINVWYRPTTDKQEKAHSNAMGAGQSIKFFTDFYDTALPYKELDIIRTAEGNPQMAYQGMIFSPGYNFTDNNFGSLSMTDGVIRQWLSGMVGSQGYKEPWVNESLASYSLQTYMGEKGYAARVSAEEQIKQQQEIARIQKEGQFLSSPLKEFKSINDYTIMMSIHGSNMFAELDFLVKAGKVRKAVKEYVKVNTNRNASGHDLVELFEKAGHPQAKGYFKGWLKPDKKE
jgi:ABC-type dipeptide/oligopeptide/nickel transport system permease subunit